MGVFILAGDSFLSLGAAFTVTNNLDSGAGSLHQAILDANANAGANIITFSIHLAAACKSSHPSAPFLRSLTS